ncbi:MAG: PAS domain S-box protein [Anaerolineaceae bacterium]|nr:MAG: PAS domain S-box protein [Anaerolineaceae bacterium]
MQEQKRLWNPPVRIAGFYLVVATLWILLSDSLLYFIGIDEVLIPGLSILKGVGFVLTTAAILYLHLSREFAIRYMLEAELRQKIKKINEAQAELTESEQRFRQIAENIRDVFYLNSPDKRQTLYISPAYETIWGRGRESLYENSQSFLDAIHPADRPRVVETFAKQRRGEEATVSYRVQRPDGTVRWVRSRAFPVRAPDGTLSRVAGIAEDITDRVQYENRLKRLSQRLVTVLDDERARIARELHDQVGQELTAIGINLGILAMHTEAISKANTVVHESSEIISTVIERIRTIIADLRPLALDDIGLAAALRWYCERFQRRTGIAVTLSADLDDGNLDPVVSNTLYQITTEALTNVIKHAGASNARVALESDDSQLTLTIIDDGHGFDVSAFFKDDYKNHWGIQIMQERANTLIGSQFRVESAPEAGTQVSVVVQL